MKTALPVPKFVAESTRRAIGEREYPEACAEGRAFGRYVTALLEAEQREAELREALYGPQPERAGPMWEETIAARTVSGVQVAASLDGDLWPIHSTCSGVV